MQALFSFLTICFGTRDSCSSFLTVNCMLETFYLQTKPGSCYQGRFLYRLVIFSCSVK